MQAATGVHQLLVPQSSWWQVLLSRVVAKRIGIRVRHQAKDAACTNATVCAAVPTLPGCQRVKQLLAVHRAANDKAANALAIPLLLDRAVDPMVSAFFE